MSEEMSASIPDLRTTVAALLDRNGAKWLRFVTRIVGNRDDAEDVLQEAVHRVLERNRPFASHDEVRMYLARAITNRAFELYHARKRDRLRCVVLQEGTIPVVDAWTPERHLQERERAADRVRMLELVRQGLARLPAKQYEALSLTLLEPAVTSIRDAGIERGIPYSTLRHRSLQGIRRLRRFIRRALRRPGPGQTTSSGS